MKKHSSFMAIALIVVAALSFTSCDDDDRWYDDYYFNMTEAVNGYFDYYGDFGTDDKTTLKWFNANYPYAYESDYRDFLNTIYREIYKSRKLMAKYLCGFWSGDMTMNYRENGIKVQLPCTITWDFEPASNSDVSGRGQEVRMSKEGKTVTNFNWAVNEYGGIELSFDPESADEEPVNMVVDYDNLDILSQEEFGGTAVGVNIDEYDDFYLVKQSYAKPQGVTRSAGISFGGKGKKAAAKAVTASVAKRGGHR